MSHIKTSACFDFTIANGKPRRLFSRGDKEYRDVGYECRDFSQNNKIASHLPAGRANFAYVDAFMQCAAGNFIRLGLS
ncbi:MAG: hypothetical protein RMZ43_009090 [Nostoc sp. CmiVER01]|uniref:hypothetical protein n=1 Tax=Nostoc sp. CmiVER01 TaxID=3075384 RepID=UPI002AD2840B|nr:hypothetical protein [Nostoc sp. CmiVER01]MDZ8123450.1 hypothetical protein [Nostoc sp. CmiVER01]